LPGVRRVPKLADVTMTKGDIEDKLRELLDTPSSMLFYKDGVFTIYAPVGRTACQGSGRTIQEAIFSYEYKRARIAVLTED
jgi:hypothetical protein